VGLITVEVLARALERFLQERVVVRLQVPLVVVRLAGVELAAFEQYLKHPQVRFCEDLVGAIGAVV
jgi:hypothetical protein